MNPRTTTLRRRRSEPAAPELGPEPSPAAEAPLVGECLDARHPSLLGRALVRWAAPDGEARESWLPTLHGCVVRAGDRVLLVSAANWPEPLVVGVVDGFARRPEPDRVPAASLALEKDESVTLTTAEGRALVEVRQGANGPVIRLADEDVHLELPGALRIDAREIVLAAKRGGIEIATGDDLHLRGEVIHLNAPRPDGS